MPVTLVSGNTRTVYAAVQSAKGTAASTPTRKFHLTEDSLDPGRQLITLPETDSSAQAPDSVVVGAEPGNSFSTWLRPNDADMLLFGVQGAKSTAGGGPNYTHTLNPQATTSYLTIWDVVPGYSTTKYVDCKVVSAAISGQSGQGITAAWTIRALSALVNQSEPGAPANFAADPAMVYPYVTVTRGGVHAGDVDAFTLTIDRGGQYFHGDNGLAAADYVNGLYACDGSLTLAFQNNQEYNAFNTGSTSGTALTTTFYDQALIIDISIDVNTAITFTTSGIRYTAFPIGIDTGGAPITVAAAFNTKRQATFSNRMSIAVKNQNAAPDA